LFVGVNPDKPHWDYGGCVSANQFPVPGDEGHGFRAIGMRMLKFERRRCALTCVSGRLRFGFYCLLVRYGILPAMEPIYHQEQRTGRR
jgi:hypothetical protein